MNKNVTEKRESPFCFSTAKAFRCGCVHLQLKLTGRCIIAANNLLVHLILWHVTWQCWYSTHYKWPALPQHLATVLRFQSKLLQIQSREGKF